jgi:hypothetical protein
MIVAQQGLSRQHWQDLLEWMVKEQGMIELEPRELAIVLDYLSTNYSEDRPNFPEKPPSEYGTLFEAPGVEETYYSCTACHSEMIVAQQGMSRTHWEELLEWMVEEQGMSELEGEDLAIVLDYLSTNYSEDRPNFPRK